MEQGYGDGHHHAKTNSSSSSSSSDEDFFQLEASELSKPLPGSHDGKPLTPFKLSEEAGIASSPDTPFSEQVVHHGLPLKNGRSPPSGELIRLSAVTQYDLPLMGSPASDSCSITQSPPLQVMGKPDIADPNRIPSSVFERTKSTTQMDWSVASNESLFSIHVGNNSFSRDHVFLLGRSGELTNFPGPLEPFPPPPTTGDSQMGIWDLSGEHLDDPGMTEAANAQAMEDVLRAAADGHINQEATHIGEGGNRSSSISRPSDGSAASIRSFAFPILTGEGGRSVSRKAAEIAQQQPPRLRQQKSLKQEQSQQSDPPPPTTPKTVHTKWFPCLSCCTCCCCERTTIFLHLSCYPVQNGGTILLSILPLA